MAILNDNHIAHIIKDLNYRGIVADDVREELIDHICSGVEQEMSKGMRFIDAYHKVLHSFGHNTGLRKTQKEILKVENKTTRLMLKNYITIAFRNLEQTSVLYSHQHKRPINWDSILFDHCPLCDE